MNKKTLRRVRCACGSHATVMCDYHRGLLPDLERRLRPRSGRPEYRGQR